MMTAFLKHSRIKQRLRLSKTTLCYCFWFGLCLSILGGWVGKGGRARLSRHRGDKEMKGNHGASITKPPPRSWVKTQSLYPPNAKALGLKPFHPVALWGWGMTFWRANASRKRQRLAIHTQDTYHHVCVRSPCTTHWQKATALVFAPTSWYP